MDSVYLQGFVCGGMVVLAIVSIVVQRRSLLGVLLGLEILGLVLFYLFVCFWGGMQKPVSLGLVFYCFEVCVMSVFLALLVGLVKCTGSDYVMVLSCGNSF
uniref:NADH-ubiquinone oxidoreductase chain 4L n=1 Tax=Chamberlainia hainesiana TaxID=1264661 RepID=A0A513X0A5_9BIVA|nr:NADH dehydrogenase subunit 4L [Chamberlainia hainesiana]